MNVKAISVFVPALLLASLAPGGQDRAFSYVDAESASWEEVRLNAVPKGKSQLSVHIPVGLPGASNLLYCDCAFNAWKLEVPPDLRTNDPKSRAIRDALRTTLVSFALSETPFVPEFRQTVWTREKGGYPIVRGELDARNRHYAFAYCVEPKTGELYICGSVRNTGGTRGKGVVRIRRHRALEREVCDYHYATFRWDAARWAAGETLPPPAVVDSTFDRTETEGDWAMPDEKPYESLHGFCGAPYLAHPAMRVLKGAGTLLFEAELEPNEERTFTVAAGLADVPPAERPSFEQVKDAARRYWDGHLSVRADFGNARENDVFRNLQFCNLQLLLDLWKSPQMPYLQPCQGGSSERFFVWVWEAMCSLRPMARLGHSDEVKKVLEFILRLQDGGCPPEGDFTTLKGAIGTTGPRWANATGSALLLTADYLLYSGDRAFLDRHLDNLIRAAKWILGEVKATRKTDADGRRIPAYGLMPGAVANDGDNGVFFTSTDSYSYAGVKRLVDLLGEIGHPEHAALAAECAQYKADIDHAIRSVQRPDGFIPRVIGSDKGGSFEFRNIPLALEFIHAGAVDSAMDEPLERMVRYWENTHSDGPFVNPFDAHIKYVGNYESGLCGHFMQRGEWKQAYFARQSFMNYAMTRDLSITAERYSEVDDGFTPWQPNASNNGRGLGMMIDRFVLEGTSRIVLLGGFAPFEDGDVSIDGVRTRHGRCSVRRTAGEISAEWEQALPAGTRLLVPAHFGFDPEGDALKSVGGELWEVVRPTKSIRSGRKQEGGKK